MIRRTVLAGRAANGSWSPATRVASAAMAHANGVGPVIGERTLLGRRAKSAVLTTDRRPDPAVHRSHGQCAWRRGDAQRAVHEGPPVTMRRMPRGLVAHHPEAVGAVNRPRPGGPERHLRLIAASGARCVVHLPRRSGEPVATGVAAAISEGAGPAPGGAGCSTLCSARGAALRSGRESLLREEFLLGRGKDEIDSTVSAVDHLIRVSHEDPSNNDWTTSTSFARRRPGILPLPRGRPLDVVEGRGRERLVAPPLAASTRGVLPERAEIRKSQFAGTIDTCGSVSSCSAPSLLLEVSYGSPRGSTCPSLRGVS
jgi:hypothetical protein